MSETGRSNPIVIGLPGSETLAASLATVLEAERGELEIRKFPDRETYLRYRADPSGRPVVLVASLVDPDPRLLPLLFAAATARDLGAISVGLAVPYLAYMRQDRRFKPGEAITSIHFARILSRALDWLVTVDPHLHRHRSLADIYSIPTEAVAAAPEIAGWIRANVTEPFLVGPDSESEQWVAAIANMAEAPYAILRKIRRGDRDVEISPPDPTAVRGRTPVLIDDIVSTGGTLVEATRALVRAGSVAPICVVTHGIFAAGSHAALLEAGAARVVTTNAIPPETKVIALSGRIAAAIARMLGGRHTGSPQVDP